MADTEKNIVKQKGRIIYVEPNDVYGSIDGVPTTPDYSDYCISVNLIAEVAPRLRESGGGSTSKFVASWTQRPSTKDADGNEVKAENWVSFLQGEDAEIYGGGKGKTNFLTTYYTDINYDDIVKKNIVEGLGIESIQVAFESYYTPTVVIKFIDVRGAALFGREEAIHDSTNDGKNLNESSVFGVFFTIPYPKFKLQIKGFYGKGVTYQLTCSDFRASFNSQTGNFEAVATFIGYSYSLLTDIPFSYLVAAPCCDYVGSDYWEKHLNTPNWALSNGHTPVKLIDLFKTIRGLIVNKEKLTETVMSEEEGLTKTNIATKKDNLNRVSTALGDFVRELEKQFSNKYVYMESPSAEDDFEQLILFSNTANVALVDTVKKAYNDLYNAYDLYNDSTSDDKLDRGLLPNGFEGAKDNLSFAKFCTITYIGEDENKKIDTITFGGDGCPQTVNGIMSIDVNGRKVFGGLAEKLLTDSLTESNRQYFGEYAFIFNLNKLRGKIAERLHSINKQDVEIDKKIKLRVQDIAKTNLGFTPYIGDIFKIIMCHLETFIHMLWECYRIIDEDGQKGRRSPDFLKVPPEQTDYPKNLKLDNGYGAWVGLFNQGYKDEQGGVIDEAGEPIAWVGDFSHNFEEEKLIRALYKAIENNQEKEDETNDVFYSLPFLPVVPNDLNNLNDIFNKSEKNDVSALTGYLSFRASQIFGILLGNSATDTLANSLGRMDAYNYFSFIQSKSDIKTQIIERASNNHNAVNDMLYNISICSNTADELCTTTFQTTGKSRHTFETAFAINKEYNGLNRHPMFKENGDSLKYVHYYLNNKSGLVPDEMLKYSDYKDIFETKGSAEKTYFKVNPKNEEGKYWEANGFLHKASTYALFDKDNGLNSMEKPDPYNYYMNSDMFNVETNRSYTDGVIGKYNELKTGSFNVCGESFTEDLNEVLDKIWHVKPSDYGKFYDKSFYILSKPVSELGMSEEDLYPDEKDWQNKEKAPKDIFNKNWLERTDSYIKFNDENGDWCDKDGNSLSLNELVIRYFNSYFPGSNGYHRQNLFADPFYYLQNDKPSKYDVTDESDLLYRQKCAKAILFLHTLGYNFKNVPEFLSKNKNSGGIYALPYGVVLLLGGLLWRKRYSDDNTYTLDGNVINIDPIQSGCDFKDNEACGYSPLGINNTLFVDDNGIYHMCALKNGETEKNRHITVAELFGGGNDWMPDNYVTNKLIDTFIKFVDTTWSAIINKLELMDKYSDGQIHPYKCGNFINEAKIIKTVYNNAKNSNKNGNEPFKYENGKHIVPNLPLNQHIIWAMQTGQKCFRNFFSNYKFIVVSKFAGLSDGRGILMLLNEKNTEVQNTLKDIYTRQVIVADGSHTRYSFNQKSDDNEITLSSSLFKSYLKGFSDKLEEIAENKNAEPKDEYVEYDENMRRDILLSMYIYIKTLWDRWLVTSTTKKKGDKTIPYSDYYNVENFYSSFIFIDAFYKNIYKDFLINLDTLRTIYDGRSKESTLFQIMGDILKAHNCLFFALPDYVDMGASDNKKAVEEMESIFRPIPYSQINELADENRFVIIYNPRLSEVPININSRKEDYFKIWNPAIEQDDKWDASIPGVLLKYDENANDNEVTRYGYYVPSFGIAFSRQDNHLFKNISVNMSTPLVTSASAAALSGIAMEGSGAPHNIAFMGQDLYPVFSNYSYICEVEMMGDAQIQPFMYFQLMNIPMWSGVYMIFNVTHNITAGNMVTRFKGMKLSRNPLPYTSSWFFYRPDNVSNDNTEGGYSGGVVGNGNYINEIIIIAGSNYKRVDNTGDHYNEEKNYAAKETYKTRDTTEGFKDGKRIRVSNEVKMLYNRLYEEIENYQKQNGGQVTWNVGITSVGYGGHSITGQHYIGYAIDLQVVTIDVNGNVHFPTGQQNKLSDKRYFIVMDILFSLHMGEIHQNIYEVYDVSQYSDEIRQYKPRCLHVGLKEGNRTDTQIYCGNKIDGNFLFKENTLLPEFKGIASKYYKINKSNFKSVFINFRNMSSEQLDKMFGLADSSGLTNEDEKYVEWADSLGTIPMPFGATHVGGFPTGETPKGLSFAKTMYNLYLQEGLSKRIAVVLTAQDADESDWGTSSLAQYSNYGGINNGSGDGKAPMKDYEGFNKSSYNNLGSYVKKKIDLLKRKYNDAAHAPTGVECMRRIQGANQNNNKYSTTTDYAVYIIRKMVPSVKKRLT